MKIGILTHPLYGNYGGMLQAYALVKILRDEGHDAYNLAFEPRSYRKVLHSPIRRAKERLRSFLLKHNLVFSDFKIPQILQIEMGQQFEKANVPKLFLGNTPAEQLKEYGVEAVVVGSDQVWRAAYARPMKSFPYFFLDFAPEEIRKSSISYAASFGTDTWEGSEEESKVCGQLLREFRAVSVRESSGIAICRDVFNVAAVRVADPTLLLRVEDYHHLIEQEDTWLPENAYLGTYILDTSAAITSSILSVAQENKLAIQPLKASCRAAGKRDRLPVSVAQWLRLIRDSECLITDSFHGCVFSIIFNKPFVCLGNKDRGTARFESLLSTYGLGNRIVSEYSSLAIQKVMNMPINWDDVNSRHNRERETSLHFLHTNLNGHA